MKYLFAALVGLLIVAGAIVGGALLADHLVDDSPTSSGAAGSGPSDALVEAWPVLAGVPPQGLPGGTYVTETGTIDDAVVLGDVAVDLPSGSADASDAGTPTAPPDGDGSEAESGPPTSETDRADEELEEPPARSEETPDPSGLIPPPREGEQFLDPCADAPVPGCPSGVGGTVETLSSDAPVPPLRIKVYPQLTRGVYPALRCDPGFESSSRLPVVVTSNAPLESGTISALAASGPNDETYTTTTDEREWFESQGTPIGTVGFGLDGVQHCISLQIPEDLPAGDVISFEVRATGRTADGREAVDQVAVQFRTAGPRPSTGIFPKWWNEVQVVMAQRDPEQGYVTSVKPLARSGPDARTTSCESVAGFPRSPWPIPDGSASPGDPRAIPETVRGHPDYTNDPSYTHQAVWNVLLHEGTRYSLCLSWVDGDGRALETEEWLVEPPNQFRFELVATGYSQNVLDGWARVRALLPDGPPSRWSVRYVDIGLPGCDQVGIPSRDLRLCATGVWGSGGPVVVVRYGQLDGAGDHYLPEAIGVDSPVRECLDREDAGTGCDGLRLPGPVVSWHHHTVWACTGVFRPWMEFDTRGVGRLDETGEEIPQCDYPLPPQSVTATMETEWRFRDGPRTDGTGPLDWRWWLAGTEPPSS